MLSLEEQSGGLRSKSKEKLTCFRSEMQRAAPRETRAVQIRIHFFGPWEWEADNRVPFGPCIGTQGSEYSRVPCEGRCCCDFLKCSGRGSAVQ